MADGVTLGTVPVPLPPAAAAWGLVGPGGALEVVALPDVDASLSNRGGSSWVAGQARRIWSAGHSGRGPGTT